MARPAQQSIAERSARNLIEVDDSRLNSGRFKVVFLGRILVADDEPKIRSFVGRALNAAGYDTDFADDGAAALRVALVNRYDLVILDLVMPEVSGRQALRELLATRPSQPVIVLSCVADITAKVEMLELGAQDYLTKPFALAELIARVKARLRADPAHPPGEIIRAGGVVLDVGHMVADSGHGPVSLTKLEFLLLRELMEHAGESVGKSRLLASVWGYDVDPGSNIIDACIRRLRSKLGFDLIKTVRGEGYQLVAR
jgi:two-component system OmpR family response regulator